VKPLAADGYEKFLAIAAIAFWFFGKGMVFEYFNK